MNNTRGLKSLAIKLKDQTIKTYNTEKYNNNFIYILLIMCNVK